MKRDDDLIRQLLFEFEADDDWIVLSHGDLISASPEDRRRHYHMLLLADAGLLAILDDAVFRLTANGHDFLDAIRSDTAWNTAKEGARTIGGATLGLMRDIALAYLRKEAATRLGIALN